MSGGPAPFYEEFEKGDRAKVRKTGEIGVVEYFYCWGGGILVKLTGINNPDDPVVETLPSATEFHKGEFWQSDLEKIT